MNNKTLILGVGNDFRGDDGIGSKVIKTLKESYLTILKNSDLLDGGIDGLALLDIIKSYSKVILIDAVNMGAAPGTVRGFSANEAKLHIHSDALSTHGFGIAEMILLAESLEFDTEIYIVGVQPKTIEFGTDLSQEVSNKIPDIIDIILEKV